MKRFSMFFLLYFAFQHAMAQNSSVRKAQSSFDKAQEFLKSESYDHAVQSLQDAVTADPSFQFAFIQLGEINRRIKSFESAKAAYKSAIELGNKIDPRAYYGLAESSLKTGDYEAVAPNIHLFLKNYKGSDKDFISRAHKYLRDGEFARQAIKSPAKYEPLNLGKEINSAHRDYSPAITADGEQLIFCRNISDNEDFFISHRRAHSWTLPEPLSNKINTAKFNEGAQSISPDGSYLFFTGCNRPDGLGRCDIYVSRKEGNNWEEPFNLGAPVNSAYWDSQPAITPDGRTLYFVSNRPGGIGGYDIWKSSLNSEGYWTEPKNLGPNINTTDDEQTPFVHADGTTLYFSSDGWPGMGEKDIFLSRMDDKGDWEKPENMGYPINTYNEETGLIVTPDGKQGLFSSDLKGGYGDMDIYQFDMPENKKPSAVTYVKGIVKDKETGAMLSAQVQVVNVKNKHKLYDDYTSAENGSFLAVMPMGGDYAFNVSAEGYLFYSAHFELKTATAVNPETIEIALEKLKVGRDVTLKNIFFNTNEYNLLPTSLAELGTLTEMLKSNTGISIEIQGHTDNVGNDIQNEKLSLSRAKAVFDYLVSQGIAASRLQYKGYGEKNPVSSNDTEEHRKLNRRTSFVITKI
jgi:outer membrane protein OmpA-like peptidoglycan-associated protein/Tol biopolymer transport system component